MKKQHILTNVRNCAILMVAFLAMPFFSKGDGNDPKDKITIELFINDKLLNSTQDSLEVTAKGTLRLTGLLENSQQVEMVKFRIQIRHASFAGTTQLFPWVEDYKAGQEFININVDEILQKVKPGDQLIIIPVSTGTKYENSGRQFQIRVIPDRC